MTQKKNITAFVIAGGKSTRFGRDKLLYKYNDITLIERVFNIIRPIFNHIIIIADDKEKFGFLDVPVMPDIIPEKGPIGGLYSGLVYSETDLNFCFASDLPYLNTELIEYMISVSKGYEITVPIVKKYWEAMHAIYSKTCIDTIKASIEANDYQIIKLFQKFNIREITEEEIRKFADPRDVFTNINYVEDLKSTKLKFETY
ncbi:MAG: molybdenum cofactor guanylyltransferase [Spirochaetes bacterium]|nr:molybdenum cofactor guanylyltransferase [Spirochaetota bacterium]